MTRRPPDGQEGADCEEAAKLPRGRRMTIRARLAKRASDDQEGAKWLRGRRMASRR